MNGQTIATLVSLLGVLTGIGLFYWGKHLERQSVNKAILAEIQRLTELVGLHRQWFVSHTDYPLIPFSTPIYNEHAKNIGMLNACLVADVARFYGYLQFLNSLQKAKDHYDAMGKSSEFVKTYLGSLETFCKTYENVFQKAFRQYKLIQ